MSSARQSEKESQLFVASLKCKQESEIVVVVAYVYIYKCAQTTSALCLCGVFQVDYIIYVAPVQQCSRQSW